jgi:hypothetical protein
VYRQIKQIRQPATFAYIRKQAGRADYQNMYIPEKAVRKEPIRDKPS